jgi:uncharacterized protein YjiS (DUF1127 family)
MAISTIHELPSTAAGKPNQAAVDVRRLLQVCRAALSSYRARDRDRRVLAAMSDRELADIGQCRASIDYEINRSFWRDL